MPEGPEVTVIAKGLQKLLKNHYLYKIDFDHSKARYNNKKPIGYPDFQNDLPLKIIDVKMKGKFIYFIFQNDWYLYNTLGMSGGWYHKQKNNTCCHIEYSNNKSSGNNAGIKKLWFDDQRHFATFKFVKGKTELEKKLKTIGPDLLNDTINKDEFIKKYRKYNHKIIDVVLNDQKIYSGIGNYLKAEILYMAGISPHAKIENIPDDKLNELLICIIDRIKASYELGGASVEHYSDLNSNKGEFHKYFKVYKQKTDPHGNKVISERVSKPNDLKSQKTYWCPAVQKDNF